MLVVGVLWLSPFSTKPLTEEELKSTAFTKYPGEIIRTAKSNNEYEIEMQMENGFTLLAWIPRTETILSLKQLSTEEVSPLLTNLRKGK